MAKKIDTIRKRDLRRYSIVPIRAVKDPEINTSFAFTVLCIICSYTDELGRTFVSQARLAKDLKRSRPGINRQIRKLLDLGYIVHAKKQYDDQTTCTFKVIYDETVATEEEARSNLSAAEQMDLAEREHKLDQATSNKGVTPGGYTNEQEGVTPGGYRGINTQEVKGGVTSRGYTERPLNDTNNDIREISKKIILEFQRSANLFGLNRVVNYTDELKIQDWIRKGYTLAAWKKLMEFYIKKCKEDKFEFPRGIGYFKEAVENYLAKPMSNKVVSLLGKATKGMKWA